MVVIPGGGLPAACRLEEEEKYDMCSHTKSVFSCLQRESSEAADSYCSMLSRELPLSSERQSPVVVNESVLQYRTTIT